MGGGLGPQAFSFLSVHTLSLLMHWGQKPGQEELEAHAAGQRCTRGGVTRNIRAATTGQGLGHTSKSDHS